MQCVCDLTELAFHYCEAGAVQPTTSDRFGQIGGVKTHLKGFVLDALTHLSADLTCAFNLVFQGHQLFFDKCLNRVGQHPLFAV